MALKTIYYAKFFIKTTFLELKYSLEDFLAVLINNYKNL